MLLTKHTATGLFFVYLPQAFEKIKSGSISNYSPELEEQIGAYYIISAKYLEEQINWENGATEQDEVFWFNTPQIELPNNLIGNYNVKTLYRQTEAKRKQELTRIINSLEGRNRIRMALYRKQMIIYSMKQRKEFAKKLMLLIKQSL
ncbi:hypothetical protein [Mangrovimonas spongiae]|uniref:Uncharacterized protein n=1 Tax=Mangrovimonas spongiae TaxID=2494697 RepID=A0A3R9MEN7_9FLAO|nr:hypothetical protein [Mangrovimonas spongiae]RSK38622.1 hypothetical protein EJA19_11225 [Mangrovimonas spongiae]